MPLALEQKNKRKLSKLKNEIVKSVDNLANNGIDIPIANQCKEALIKNLKEIEISWEEMGSTYNDKFNQYDMINSCLVYKFVFISQFINSPNAETYNQLLNGYFLEIIYYFAEKNYQKNLNNGFDTDRTLSLFFAMTYCTSSIQSEMMNVLEYYKNREEFQDDDGTQEFYGAKTILPLAYYFYQQNKRNQTWAFDLTNIHDSKGKLLYADILANVTPLYQKVIDNIQTDDMELLQNLIDELCQYRLDNSKGNYLLEFNGTIVEYFPIEILFLLKYRVQNGHSIDGIHHLLIDDFLPYFLNDFSISQENKIFLERALNNTALCY